MTKLLQQCFLFFIVVVIPGHNLGNSQVSVNRTIGPTLVLLSADIFQNELFRKIPSGMPSVSNSLDPDQA